MKMKRFYGLCILLPAVSMTVAQVPIRSKEPGTTELEKRFIYRNILQPTACKPLIR